MDKRLEELLGRVADWPSGAQEDAVAALELIEVSVNANNGLGLEEQEARLEGLRQMLRTSIARGGSFTEEEVEASISAALDAREQGRKSA